MAPPSSTSIVFALFLAFALVASCAVQPSEAIRPTSMAETAPRKPAATSPAAARHLPGSPFPRFPGLHPRPNSPASPPRPSATTPSPPMTPAATPQTSSATATAPAGQVTDCLPPLMGLTPCLDYLTNAGGVSAPPSTCCDGFRSLVNDAPICLCHGLNGDINRLMPAPMDFTRMMSLPARCGVALPMQTLASCSTVPVPPLVPHAVAPSVSAPSPDSSP